ncbi:MAG: histidine phosphatase family protein [Candidatus Hodarchaeales archaeon]|jgi:probable phosphoglycerate mutase
MRIILVRHGQTAHNAESRIMGWLPTPLNQTGRDQIAKLASFLKEQFSVSKIYASDLLRAKESTEIISNTLDMKNIKYLKPLREHKFGDWEGKLYSELKLKENFNRYLELKDEELIPPNGESIIIFKNRVLNGFDNILNNNKNFDKDILIVAHGGTNRVILGEILNLSFLKTQQTIKQSNACLNELKYDFNSKIFSIHSLNVTSFL